MSKNYLAELTRIGDMTKVTELAHYTRELVHRIMHYAFPANPPASIYVYGPDGKVGVGVQILAMAIGVDGSELLSLAAYIPDLSRGGLFLGTYWNDHVAPTQDGPSTMAAIDIEALPYVITYLGPEDVKHRDNWAELCVDSEDLKDVLKEANTGA